MFKEKLKKAIEKYLDPDSKQSKSSLKGNITKVINTATPADVSLIRETLEEFDSLPGWLQLRFQKGSLYEEGGRVFGWYSENQIQAESLPVVFDTFEVENERRIVKYIKVVASSKGFYPSQDLPFTETFVNVPIDDDLLFLELWEHGYASPCPLQWSWFERSRWDDREGFIVERSIISHGFWQAWKWWPGCWLWYINKRPELFEDAELWGMSKPEPPIRHEPLNNPYAAVLGGSPEYQERFRQRLLVISDEPRSEPREKVSQKWDTFCGT